MQKPQKFNFFSHKFAVVNADGSTGTSWRKEFNDGTIAEIIATRQAKNGKAIVSVEHLGNQIDEESYNDAVSVYENRIEENYLDNVRTRRRWTSSGNVRHW